MISLRKMHPISMMEGIDAKQLRNLVTPAAILAALFITGISVFANSRSGASLTGLLGLFVPWFLVAGAAGSRPLWDPNFVEGRRFGQRGWQVFWKYYGPIGILISVLFNVQLSLVNDHLDPPEWYSGTTFFVVVALIGVAMFAIPLTPIRQIGSGLFVGVGVITLFPILLYLVLFLVLPYFAYVATAVVCWIIATRTNAPTEESQPFGGGSPSP